MSQATAAIANISRTLFRQAVNAITQAIQSLNSGLTTPTETYAYMWWADTTTGLLKQRNAANTGWITVGALADLGIQSGAQTVATVGGTVDAITLTLDPVPTALTSTIKRWRAAGANTSTTPTVNTASLGVKTLVKGNNLPLAVGDIPGAGAWMLSVYDATLDKEVLLNPATVLAATQSQMEAASSNVVAVTPLSQKWHPGMPKYIGFVNGATGAITNIYSASGTPTASRTGAGTYTIANCALSAAGAPFLQSLDADRVAAPGAIGATGFSVTTRAPGGANGDASFYFAYYGDL